MDGGRSPKSSPRPRPAAAVQPGGAGPGAPSLQLPRGYLEYYGLAPRGSDGGAPTDGPIQRAAEGAAAPGSDAGAAVAAARGEGGGPVAPSVRRQVEATTGSDLGGVRVHTGPLAAQAAASVGARAFTLGQEVYFGAGQYQPGSAGGDRLIAHELTHAVQQRGGASSLQPQLEEVSQPHEPAELEADAVAERVVEALHRPGGKDGPEADGVKAAGGAPRGAGGAVRTDGGGVRERPATIARMPIRYTTGFGRLQRAITAVTAAPVEIAANRADTTKLTTTADVKDKARWSLPTALGARFSAKGDKEATLVAGNTGGAVRVKAENEDKKSSATVDVPQIKLDQVKVAPASLPADGKTTAKATARVAPAGRAVKWSLPGTSFGATIDAGGVITAGPPLAAGTKFQWVEVKAEDQKLGAAAATGKFKLNQHVTVANLKATPEAIAADGADKASLKVDVTPAGERAAWSLGRPALGASFATQAAATAELRAGKQGGTVKVEAKSSTDKKQSVSVDLPQIKIGAVKVTPKEIHFDGAATAKAEAKVEPTGRTVKWGFDGPAFGSTIDAAGTITPGKTVTKGKEFETVKVKAEDDKIKAAFAAGSFKLWDADLMQAKKDYPLFLKGGPYKKAYARGNGKFDAEYQPPGKVLQATMKLLFTFIEDLDPTKLTAANQAKYKGKDKWTAASKAQYRQNFMNQARAAWDKKYTMGNVREPKSVWGKLGPVQTRLKLVDKGVAPGTEHFNVKWHKHPGTHSTSNAEGGRAGVFGGVTDMYSGDENADKGFWNAAVRAGEEKRLNRINPGPIEFPVDSAVIDGKYDAKLQFFATYLKRISSPRFNVTLTGHASTTDKKATSQSVSQKRAQAVAQRLQGNGLSGHPVAQRAVGQAGAAATASWQKVEVTAVLPAGWQNQFKTIPHEFGHMLGLGDEYVPSGDLPHHDLVEKAFGKDYADQTSKRGDDANANIMYVGDQVRPHEYVTFWDALAQATSGAPVPVPPMGHDHWKINA